MQEQKFSAQYIESMNDFILREDGRFIGSVIFTSQNSGENKELLVQAIVEGLNTDIPATAENKPHPPTSLAGVEYKWEKVQPAGMEGFELKRKPVFEKSETDRVAVIMPALDAAQIFTTAVLAVIRDKYVAAKIEDAKPPQNDNRRPVHAQHLRR